MIEPHFIRASNLINLVRQSSIIALEPDAIESVVLGGTRLLGRMGGVWGTFISVMIMGFLDI